MRRIVIYVEGGGDSAQQKTELRQGLQELFRTQRQAAAQRGLSLSFVPAGSRNEARRQFTIRMSSSPSDIVGLLADSEEPVPAEVPGKVEQNALERRQHLVTRDGWQLTGFPAAHIHLMVQCMEAWIVADPEALSEYYGAGFKAAKLPVRTNLEEEPKAAVYSKLADATRGTSKGEYSQANHSKIRHAGRLLAMIDAAKVAKRCPRFATFSGWLGDVINRAAPS